jgi:hypothetical protein
VVQLIVSRKEWTMKKGRIILIIAAVLALVVAGAVLYFSMNINSIVKAAIEKYGSQVLKTGVHVSSVKILLSSGEGAINGLTVKNPPGFFSPNIFRLGNISTRIEVGSVTKTPIVIDDIRISGPEVSYEMNSTGTTNLDVLKKNLPGAGGGPTKEPGEAKEKETKLFIRRLVIEQGRVEVRIAAPGSKPVIVDLPRLELTDIGRNGGATPAQVTNTLVTALAEQTAEVVARTQGERYLRKGAEDLLKRYLGK